MPRAADTLASSLMSHVVTLIRSPAIAGYLVGITRDIPGRQKSYATEGFPLFYILKTGLLATEAAALEEGLFKALTENRRLIQYRKYQSPKRNDGYRRSTGKNPGTERNFILYVAAWPAA